MHAVLVSLPQQTECPGAQDRDTSHVADYLRSLLTLETSLHTGISNHANKQKFLIHVTKEN